MGVGVVSTWEILYKSDRYAAGEDWDVLDGEDQSGVGGVQGLYAVSARLHDLERSHGDGSVKGPVTLGAALVSFPLFIPANVTAEDVPDLCDALRLVWEPIRDGSLETLTVTIAGATYSMLGAPAPGFDIKIAKLKFGHATAFCPFTVYDAQITRSGS